MSSEEKKRTERVFVIDIRRQVARFSNRLISYLDSRLDRAWGGGAVWKEFILSSS